MEFTKKAPELPALSTDEFSEIIKTLQPIRIRLVAWSGDFDSLDP